MSKHWYRNNLLNKNRLIDDDEIIPDGYSRRDYSLYMSKLQSGENHWNYGKHHSDSTKLKMSRSGIGRVFSDTHRLNLSISAKKSWSTGSRVCNWTGENHKGKNNPRYGKGKPLSCEIYKRFQEKRNATLAKNNSFNRSEPEENYYRFLLTLYPYYDVVRQYKSDKYPFNCDFYIKSEDKYIECHYSWLHGGHPFNKDNKEDIKKLKLWQERSTYSEFYKKAIETWTIRDVKKAKVAKENNLNIEFLYQY